MTTHAPVIEATKYDVDSPLAVVLEQWTTQQGALHALSADLELQLERCNNARSAINAELSAYIKKQCKPEVLHVYHAQWAYAKVQMEEYNLEIHGYSLVVYLDGRPMFCLTDCPGITKRLAEQGLYFTKELALKSLQKQYAPAYLAIEAALEAI